MGVSRTRAECIQDVTSEYKVKQLDTPVAFRSLLSAVGPDTNVGYGSS